MEIEHARRIMETTSPETVNQYLRFGWKLVNQHVTEPCDGQPARVNYVLASFRALEDTRQIITVDNADDANTYLNLGWRLIDKYLKQGDPSGLRHETLHFVLVWASDDPPQLPGMGVATDTVANPAMFDDLGEFSKLPIIPEN